MALDSFDQVTGDSLSFIGTATTLLRLGPFTLLTDPNFLHRGQWAHVGHGLVTRRRTEPAAQPADLPPLTAVVLSHLHGDHFDRIASRDLGKDLPIVTTEHAASRLRRRGFAATLPLQTWESQAFTDGGATLTITAVPARHAPGPLARLLPPVMGTILEYRPTAGAKPVRIYVSGDTLVHSELGQLRTRYPDIDLAVVHLGGTRVLGILLTMDHKQGVDLLELLAPRNTVPVHFDDYGLFHSPLSNFVEEVHRRRPPSALHLLNRGETLLLAAVTA